MSAHARGQPMELLLTPYALERLLHRASLSPHRERFVLKGLKIEATREEIDRERLRRAIAATFARRTTAIPAEVPDGLTDAFAADPGKQRQWDAFARNLAGTPPQLRLVVSELRHRLAGLLALA
jgi:hypothetical protein